MYVINKPLEEITEADLQYLIDEERIEKKVLEYKSELPRNSDSEKKEYLADVSSFANAIGGDIIYGIKENRKTGKPEKLDGIEIDNVDQDILRLEQIIRDGIEPNIPSSALNITDIQLKNSKYILIIRINRSCINPHRVSFKAWDRFYTRSTNGKYRFDVQELRAAFQNEEIDFNHNIRIVVIYNEDLRMNYHLEEPKGVKQQYGEFLANLPENVKLKLTENKDKIDLFLLEISPYLLLRDIAYFFQRGWNIKIDDLNKDMQHRVENLEYLEDERLTIEDIPILNGDSYIHELKFDLKKYLNWISIPNFKVPKDLVISIARNNKAEILINLKHPFFNYEILFKATTGGLYLITNHPQYIYLFKDLSDYNFKEIRIESKVNFVLDNPDNSLFDNYLSYTKNLRQIIEERFSYDYFLKHQVNSIQYIMLKKLDEIIDTVKKKERLKKFVRKLFSRKNKKIEFF